MPLLFVFFLFFFKHISMALADVGSATAYGPPYLPAKCIGNDASLIPPGNLFVAVNEGLWEGGAACGRRYKIRCLSGANRPCKSNTIEVQVVDLCRKSPCPSSFLMSKDAFNAISTQPNVIIKVEYTEF